MGKVICSAPRCPTKRCACKAMTTPCALATRLSHGHHSQHDNTKCAFTLQLLNSSYNFIPECLHQAAAVLASSPGLCPVQFCRSCQDFWLQSPHRLSASHSLGEKSRQVHLRMSKHPLCSTILQASLPRTSKTALVKVYHIKLDPLEDARLSNIQA